MKYCLIVFVMIMMVTSIYDKEKPLKEKEREREIGKTEAAISRPNDDE